MGCKDSPAYILDQTMCLYSISKHTPPEPPFGELRRVLLDQEDCPERDCVTIKTVHQLDLPLRPERCDSSRSRRHNGRLYSCDLTHALIPGTPEFPEGRGFHGGTFTWADQGFLASGTLSGISNAGTHRPPVGKEGCQDCYAPEFMEGRFCGVIRRSGDPALLGCQVFGAYRLRFTGSLVDSEDRPIEVRGVLEGVIVCECAPAAQASAS